MEAWRLKMEPPSKVSRPVVAYLDEEQATDTHKSKAGSGFALQEKGRDT
jgi:hypothetical protein